MGHRKIATTLRYTQLVDMGDDEWLVKVASSIEEFTELLERALMCRAWLECGTD
jgi:hypothetical protein